jgi:hypothetical protein
MSYVNDQFSTGVLLGFEQNNGHTKLNTQITIQYQIAEMGAGNTVYSQI